MREWEIKVDDKGRICLPAVLWREFSLEGRKVLLRKRGRRVLELRFPPTKPTKRIGTVPWEGITTDAAEQLHQQGIAAEADGDRKVVVLKTD